MNVVTGLVHSHRKAVQTLNAKEIKTSSTLELEALKALIETELQRRGEAKNYLVKRVSKDNIVSSALFSFSQMSELPLLQSGIPW